jgi:hypothetical protein
VAVGVYYALIALLGEGIRVTGAAHAAVVWGSVAIVAGPLLGAAGETWRRRSGWPRVLAVAPLAATFVAEGVVFGLDRVAAIDRLPSDPGALILAAEVAVGGLLPALLLPAGERLRGYVATISLAVVGVVSLGVVVDLVRAVADTF